MEQIKNIKSIYAFINKLQQPGVQKWLTMFGIAIGTLMFALDVYIVNIALPELVESLGANSATIRWVVLSYLLTLTVMVLGVGRLGDIWEKKWLYIGGVSLFSGSSLMCGLATEVGFLIGFRALQGLGAVFISVLGLAIIAEVFPGEERQRALGIISGIHLVGVALGPAVGELLISLGGWRLIFLINLPIGLVTGLIVALFVPCFVKNEVKQKFDVIGAVIMALTLGCFSLGMTLMQTEGFRSPTTLIFLSFAAIGLICFLVVESRVLDPMLDLKIFRNLQLSLGLLLGVIVYSFIAGIMFIVPFFLELVKQYPSLKMGFLLATSPILGGLISPIAGILSEHFKPYIIRLIGLLLIAVGCLAISTFDGDLTVSGYILRIAPYGLGTGMFISPNISAVIGAMTKAQLGIASSLVSLSRNLGQTIGLSTMGTLFSSLTLANTQLDTQVDLTGAPIDALIVGVQTSFRLASIILIIAIVIGAFSWWKSSISEQRINN